LGGVGDGVAAQVDAAVAGGAQLDEGCSQRVR
jgi:hypothetical protein